MDFDAGRQRAGAWRMALGFIGLVAIAASARAAGPDETRPLDCGFNALFILLELEGRPGTLERLEAALPRWNPEGYSMAELAAAGHSLGLDLEGVRFVKGDRGLTRPAIAYLRDARGGHFAVLRPVGATGTMVQMIDPPAAPHILDYDGLLAARSWTGRILIPSPPWIVRNMSSLILSAGGVLFLFACLRRFGWSRPTSTPTASHP